VSGIPAEWVSESEEKSHEHTHLDKLCVEPRS